MSVQTVESMDTKQLVQADGSGSSKSEVTEISEATTANKQVDETWTSNTSAQQSTSSHVNAIGCVDEGLWIFLLEDCKKRRYTEFVREKVTS